MPQDTRFQRFFQEAKESAQTIMRMKNSPAKNRAFGSGCPSRRILLVVLLMKFRDI
jgi:hypothetical protein